MRFPTFATLLSAACCCFTYGVGAAEVSPLESARTVFDKWVEVQEGIARDRRDWAVEQVFLDEEIRQLREEISALKEKSVRLTDETAATEAAVAKAAAETSSLKGASAQVAAELPKAESELRRLAVSFPAPLMAQVEPLMNRLPREAAGKLADVSQRLVTVVGLLSQVDKFNGSFTVAAELRQNPDGAEVQVNTLYLGLAQAWFVSPDRRFAGYGKPGAAGWEWTPEVGLAGSVSKAIAVQENTTTAEYVGLPVSIK